MYIQYKEKTPQLDEAFNIATVCCDEWAQKAPKRVAIIQKNNDGSVEYLNYGDMQKRVNQTANALISIGVSPGDRVGIMLPQCFEAAIMHLALYKMGAIAVPLFILFGLEAIHHRASNSGIKLIVTNNEGMDKLNQIWAELPELKICLTVDEQDDDNENVKNYFHLISLQSEQFSCASTNMDTPALIIYTSGTSGYSKGALHAHRVLLGHLAGVSLPHNNLPQPEDKIWTPADWAWIGGLFDVLLPALYFGVPVIAYRMKKFDAEATFSMIEELGIRNMFLPPTALKLLRQIESPEKRWNFNVRSIACGGESLGTELIAWGKKTFGVIINEFYGQTECNLVLTSCAAQGVHKQGAIGKTTPGFHVAIVDENGVECKPLQQGNIAVATPNLSQFLCYWNNPKATAEKYIGNWLITGDLGSIDEDGYVSFLGRNDDVINSAGYRIGPMPIEDCLLQHPAVQMAAVIGKKDPFRSEIVKAFIVLNSGFDGDETLIKALQQLTRKYLSAHEYPREIEFVESLPMTTTGKIIRNDLRVRENT